jgi:hypothetical protein
LLHEYLGVTTIAFKDDTVYMVGDKVRTGTQCCCGAGCDTCIDIWKVVAVPSFHACDPIDAQDCTITIPDEYALPVTVRLSGAVDDDVKFNGSILEPGKYLIFGTCNGGHFIGTADGGPGYVDKEVNARTFTLTLVDNFGVNSIMSIKVCIDPENTQEVCIPPTADCPVPPEPLVRCCQRVQECDDITVANCVLVHAEVCCKSYSYGTETNCEGSTPPYTSCASGGESPSDSTPYDCVNGAFASGAWVTVSGWSANAGDRSGLSADEIALIDELDALANSTFFVPFTCLGTAETTIDLGEGASRDTFDCSGSNWFATVSVNLCARTASVYISNPNPLCVAVADIGINLSDLTAISVPCNSWTGCNCAEYQDDIPLVGGVYGGGTLSVDSLEP